MANLQLPVTGNNFMVCSEAVLDKRGEPHLCFG